MDLIYGVIGTGAIGGFYGSRLARSGKEVHFLLHSDYEYVKEHGLQIDSCDGDFHLDKVNAYSSTAYMPVCDVVLVCLKTTHNQLLPTLLPPLLHEHSIVLLIQNGIGVEEDLQAAMPGIQTAAGLAFICSAKSGPGRINHQCYGSINIGNYSCRDEKRLHRVVTDFREAGILTNEVEYNEARWKKAVWNMPFNGMSVALRARTDQLLGPDTESLIREQMLEVIEAAQHLGVKNIDATFADKMIANTRAMVPYFPSMRLDYDHGRPMEINYLYTRPISIARKAGFAMPKLEMLEKELRFLESEQRNRA